MAVIFNDTFTTGTTSELTGHTPDTGTSWTRLEQVNTTSVIDCNATVDQARPNSGGTDARVIYLAVPAPSIATYDVQLTCATYSTTASNAQFLVARCTDASNYYSAGTYPAANSPNVKIFKTVAGVVTELASGTTTLADGDVLKLQIRTNSQKLFVNGVEVLAATDTALTSAGSAGFGCGNAWVSTNDFAATWRWDNFSVDEVAEAAASAVVTTSFMTV